MKQRFHKIIDDLNLFTNKDHILLAISGGVDSMVLLNLMCSIPDEVRPCISIAHLNHQLREESAMEEAFIREQARAYQLPFYSKTWPKGEHPTNGIEEAARNFRYEFFNQVMEEQQMTILMTGHHLNDQVETVLMKLTRGGVIGQLTGIEFSQPYKTGKLIRPLLSFAKEDLYAYANENHIDYKEDLSNSDLTYTRNRFRHQVIPLLEKENPKFLQHIAEFSNQLQDLLEIVRGPICEQYARTVHQINAKEWRLNIEEFNALSDAFKRQILSRILTEIYYNKEELFKSSYISILNDWIQTGESNTSLQLQNNIVVEKEYNELIFSKDRETQKINLNKEFEIHTLNKWVKISDHEKVGIFECTDPIQIENSLNERNALTIQENMLELPLTIRYRQPGDRMQYAGLNGTKKIKDIFIDEKTPKKNRDRAWLIVDKSGKILWLLGYRKMNLFTTQETDKLTYILRYENELNLNKEN